MLKNKLSKRALLVTLATISTYSCELLAVTPSLDTTIPSGEFYWSESRYIPDFKVCSYPTDKTHKGYQASEIALESQTIYHYNFVSHPNSADYDMGYYDNHNSLVTYGVLKPKFICGPTENSLILNSNNSSIASNKDGFFYIEALASYSNNASPGPRAYADIYYQTEGDFLFELIYLNNDNEWVLIDSTPATTEHQHQRVSGQLPYPTFVRLRVVSIENKANASTFTLKGASLLSQTCVPDLINSGACI